MRDVGRTWEEFVNHELQALLLYNNFQETNKPLTERWTILKRCYECWKTQQFTQQSALEQKILPELLSSSPGFSNIEV